LWLLIEPLIISLKKKKQLKLKENNKMLKEKSKNNQKIKKNKKEKNYKKIKMVMQKKVKKMKLNLYLLNLCKKELKN